MITYTDKVKKKGKTQKENIPKKMKKKNTSSQLELTRQTYDLNCETIII
jgi:hypothetical protein